MKSILLETVLKEYDLVQRFKKLRKVRDICAALTRNIFIRVTLCEAGKFSMKVNLWVREFVFKSEGKHEKNQCENYFKKKRHNSLLKS